MVPIPLWEESLKLLGGGGGGRKKTKRKWKLP